MMLLGETSELSFELAIEDRSDRSSRYVSSGVAKKCVGADPSANHCDEYRRRCSPRRRGQSACVEATSSPRASGSRSREGPVGKRDLRVCLGICRSSKTSLNDVKPERGED
jgi:hypothetical protein